MTVSRQPAGPISSEKPASARPSSPSRSARYPVAAPWLTCVSQPPTSTKPRLNWLAHQPADPSRRQLEAARRYRAAIGCGHFLRYRTIDVVTDPKSFGYRGGEEIALGIHVLDQLSLTIIDPWLSNIWPRPILGIWLLPRNISGSCSVNAIGLARLSSVASLLMKPDR